MSTIIQRCFKILVYLLTPEYSDIGMEQERKHYFQEQSQSELGMVKAFFWIMVSIIFSLLISRL